MNSIYSRPELFCLRWISPLLKQANRDQPVIMLTGARQVRKSTLLLNTEPFCRWRYHTMDDFDVLRQARNQPEALWSGTDCVVLDEVQKTPEVLSAVKQTVDQDLGRFRFVLSGSANLLLMKKVSESLAGRAVYFVLEPMTLGELNQTSAPDVLSQLLSGDFPGEGQSSVPAPDSVLMILRGFMPALLKLDTPQAWVRWWEGYVSTYLERDLRQISQIDTLVDFRRIMELVALRSGQLLNQSEISRDAGISQPTVHRYLNILETTHLFERLPAYTSSHTTRLIKTPKAFWIDPGLAVFLSG
jgi:predicted AAA+ superfamily ATPase